MLFSGFSEDKVIAGVLFFKRAEALAGHIKELQGEMADYNTLMDKLNTDTEIDDILSDCEMVREITDNSQISVSLPTLVFWYTRGEKKRKNVRFMYILAVGYMLY